MVTAAVNTLTHAIINKGPLWIFSGMSGEPLGQTTASKHGSDRAGLPTHANSHGITAPPGLVQAGANTSFIIYFFNHFCTFVNE